MQSTPTPTQHDKARRWSLCCTDRGCRTASCRWTRWTQACHRARKPLTSMLSVSLPHACSLPECAALEALGPRMGPCMSVRIPSACAAVPDEMVEAVEALGITARHAP